MIDTIRKCLAQEATALQTVADSVDESTWIPFVYELSACSGHDIFTGVGKSGIVAHKIASSFNSLSVIAFHLDPLAMLHGDLGALTSDDIVVMLSNSGETDILLEVARNVLHRGNRLFAIIGNVHSSLARIANRSIIVETTEAGPFGLIPSTSCIAMMAVGDALLCALAEIRESTSDQLKHNHPQGFISTV